MFLLYSFVTLDELEFDEMLPRELRTDRLQLRQWLPADRTPFAAMNADPKVTEYLPGPLSREDSDALVSRIDAHFDQYGFGFWAVEICNVVPFAGFVGLAVSCFATHLNPVRGNWMAAGRGALGSWICDRSSPGRARFRLRRA